MLHCTYRSGGLDIKADQRREPFTNLPKHINSKKKDDR
jgi:hypothetical protein